MAGACFDCDIEKNALLAAKGISTAAGNSGSTANNLGRSVPGSVSSFLVRDNRFLAFHGAMFINSANGLDVLHNEMRGLSPESLKQLQGNPSAPGLTRDNITAFQSAVTQAFAAPQGTSFMGTGIFLISGFRVNICQNRIAAQAAFLCFLVIEATLEDNEILASSESSRSLPSTCESPEALLQDCWPATCKPGYLLMWPAKRIPGLAFPGLAFFRFRISFRARAACWQRPLEARTSLRMEIRLRPARKRLEKPRWEFCEPSAWRPR